MAAQRMPTVFLSHSHLDKLVARRLVRRLTAHGIKVWIDERELRVGAALTSSIRGHIQRADTVLVIASQASTKSTWVGQELDFAREHGRPIIPLFVEPVAQHPRFIDFLGIDGTQLDAFADGIHRLMRDLFLSLDLDLPAADPAVLTAGLRELAREEPGLAPLILGHLDSEGVHGENLETVSNVAFHALDDALNALFDLEPGELTALIVAHVFGRTGAGVRALSLWIEATGDGGTPLVTALGNRTLELTLIPTAIKLLTSCSPPNNHALYQFIHRNSAGLDSAQRRSVIRLVTWPVRGDTGRLGDVLGWVALKHFPDATEIQQMWVRWIHGGAFDGEPVSPRVLARYLADADREKLDGWETVNEALRSYVRGCLRSGDKRKVVKAMDHVQAAADLGAPVLAALLREADGASGTAEWDSWTARDADTSELMRWYVFEFAKEAAGDRDWLRAWNNTQRMVALSEKRRLILGKAGEDPTEER